jgi:P-type Ca2+ transporter type 2C
MTASVSPGSGKPQAWHTLEPQEAVALLGSDRSVGLPLDQVSARQAQYGLNELEEVAGRSGWKIFLDQFTNIMLVMLIVVALVSLVLDLVRKSFPKDAIAIFSIVILNGVLGYLQESRAEKALAALKKMSSPFVRVLRGGREVEVAAKELVPGDVMFLEAGDQVAADGRLLEAANLQIREAALTGEAESVSKQVAVTLPENAPLGDRVNLVYQGTEVVQGRAFAVVTGTAMKTELGKIATLLQAVESEPTPLQQRMTQLGNVLVSSSMALVGIVVLGGFLRTRDFSILADLVEVALSMAVAVVPEGLPAVITVTLALGTQRMVRRNALIRKLPAVETLGSVTTICSDKTGTLTQNKMVIQHVHTLAKTFKVTGNDYSPVGEFMLDGARVNPDEHPDLVILLYGGVLCNDASLQHEGSLWRILGDPTEGAFLTLGGKFKLDKLALAEQFRRVAEIPFSSERKRMSVLVQNEEGLDVPNAARYVMFSKGSPELILARCQQVKVGSGVEALTGESRDRILAQNNDMAMRGLRVLGLAMRSLETVPEEAAMEGAETDLIWLGLVGMLDAPRPEVREAVAACRKAGIRPVMITGDHQLTARAIAEDLGIALPGEGSLTGQELDQLTPEDFEHKVSHVNVYARVAPEHKLRIVQALQKRNDFVAMTGDGVNDAPALKQADIGIAMGITGTDVSKEASDMVLLDDNFATIVAATEEGRVVYDNIRRFIKYILGSNIGEVLTIAAAPLMGLGGVPLSPLQILWMNLVTDGLPALALAVEPAEPNVMERPPYNPRESIFARGLGFYMIRVGIILAILTIVMMAWAYRYVRAPGFTGDPESWKTMVFTTLCIAQMGHALAIRSNSQLTAQINPLSNPYLIGSVALTTTLQLMLIYVAPLRNFFGLHVLDATELWVCFGFSALMFVWIEMEKVFFKSIGKQIS